MLAILLAASQITSQQDPNLDEVNSRLSGTVNSAREGWLFHQLSHFICQNAERQNYAVGVWLRYKQLEREYLALGGTTLPDDEQTIFLEPYHTQCATEIASRWQAATNDAERELRMMRWLLDRKRQLMK